MILIPAKIIYEDKDVLALDKSKSKSNIHFVIIPKAAIVDKFFVVIITTF
jgi:diadenosine tetraphosphate (Ap4A) HIT family hydrolase